MENGLAQTLAKQTALAEKDPGFIESLRKAVGDALGVSAVRAANKYHGDLAQATGEPIKNPNTWKDSSIYALTPERLEELGL